MPYEVIVPGQGDSRGVFYWSLTAAMVAAGPNLEVWQVADDEAQTRMVCCWPAPEHQPAQPEAPDDASAGVATIVADADRVAAVLLAEYQPADYSRTLAVVALAYAKGRRDGYAEGAKFVAEALGELSQVAAL